MEHKPDDAKPDEPVDYLAQGNVKLPPSEPPPSPAAETKTYQTRVSQFVADFLATSEEENEHSPYAETALRVSELAKWFNQPDTGQTRTTDIAAKVEDLDEDFSLDPNLFADDDDAEAAPPQISAIAASEPSEPAEQPLPEGAGAPPAATRTPAGAPGTGTRRLMKQLERIGASEDDDLDDDEIRQQEIAAYKREQEDFAKEDERQERELGAKRHFSPKHRAMGDFAELLGFPQVNRFQETIGRIHDIQAEWEDVDSPDSADSVGKTSRPTSSTATRRLAKDWNIGDDDKDFHQSSSGAMPSGMSANPFDTGGNNGLLEAIQELTTAVKELKSSIENMKQDTANEVGQKDDGSFRPGGPRPLAGGANPMTSRAGTVPRGVGMATVGRASAQLGLSAIFGS